MIRVNRGAAPPDIQKKLHEKQLKLMGFYYEGLSDPSKDDIKGYDIAKDHLANAQYHKCCYCEYREPKEYHDVEHWRPKGRADREPGSTLTHGYWWLAHSWENLLFACAHCNRSGKNDSFPLEDHCVLARGADPPGLEKCLLIDPASENGIKYIQFTYREDLDQWHAKPRNANDQKARWSIDVYGLNKESRITLYGYHWELHIMPVKDALLSAVKSGNAMDVKREFRRAKELLLNPKQTFVGLSYDALLHFVPNQKLAPWGLEWPDLSK